MSRAGSSRWSPTPEQLMILEQLYRSGIRTPSASQIQHITTHLCFYGRIEGKNVFYWFQNHKARDRQKLRRKLNKQLQLQQQQQHMLAHQCQVINHHEDNNKSHWSFGGFDSCSPGSSSTQQVPFINPAILLPQGETSSETWKSSGQKQELQQSEVMDDRRNMTSSLLYSNNNGSMHSSYCCWSVNEEEESSYAYCCCCSSSSSSRPLLKTLDLFPTTSSKLKEHPFNP